ncbi:L-amino acid N-acyltransferase YncA [Jatrophihabitans sp. GAS493]|uniref:GNAT family N-acetyltransferase n=1 Tax=Jatrophihabitans sp. GAS493 TaxID=1907575 RepID=UPI000BB77578|nr:GNAT family N-acetyltransferase [Jatrophihabitans sp. GAS493]SOD74164.1 L-amino acid N-acyltransferase YncA [Jatrophihabitans sp. GAS493]
MSSVQLRRAGASDWPAIWPIWSGVVAAGDTYTYDPATDSPSAERAWLGSGEVWIAEDRGSPTPLGIYRISPNQQGPGSHVANGSYMVATGARRHGVGRQLVTHSLERACELGYHGMQFNAVAATNVHAIALYLDLGFSTVGVIPGGFRHPAAGFVDLLIMYRPL